MNYKEMIKALNAIEDERRIPESVVIEALKEAMCKAYKKDAELSDINVEAEINEKNSTIDIYQIYNVVENVEDDELEMSLEDAREYKEDAVLGDMVRRKVEITTMSRAAATLARNVMRQKIREAEKVAVYNEYIDQLNEMVLGIVESVKDKFTLVNLGKTVAMMPRSAELPGERLVEGQKLRVVITEVNKDTKGSQVLVSRADPMLVKRLFEKEVPEIFQGIVEIKAIAREAGERTKMAVMSHNDEIDPIGACIGQRGNRVQEIIEELHGEKIDIFLWNDDITQLVKNALAPAEVEAVLPGDDDKSLLVIVNEDQLSLAIGKKGKNARLAVKLCNRKIDIKTRAELEEMGKDFDTLLAEAEIRREEMRRERERREIERLEAEARAAEEKRLKAAEELIRKANENGPAAETEEEIIPEEMREAVKEKIRTDMAMLPEETPAEPAAVETPAEPETPAVEEPVTEEPEQPEETLAEPETPAVEETPAAEPKNKRIKADLEEIAAKNEYVSVFEKLADTSKPKTPEKPKRKKRKGDDDEFKTRNKILEQQLRKDISVDIKPVYTEEELEEIERQQLEEEESKYDIDYDEYEDYYDDEEMM
ncbi:MAG: transcription termination/antitermination protein NusA [Solobacterium sp.]|nr:transcription termination/antitermination protein NusA [Solobacterium sp.]MBR3126680.1 transcription termination/antitermination protein NusA [Solobacterium sp.]